MKIKIDVVKDHPQATLPSYATEDAACMDIYACLPDGLMTLAPESIRLVSSGIRVAVPKGYEMQVRPRSGMALKQGVTVLNTPGCIDPDYRGVVGVILVNHSGLNVTIKHGDRIAQLAVVPLPRIEWNPVDELGATTRGEGGFGSSGT